MPTLALQRRSSSPRSVSALIHLIGLSFFTASFLWLPNIGNPLHQGFGGSYQFLTIIALTVSTFTFTIGLLDDTIPSEPLFTFKNFLSVCATPLDVLVTVLYWTLHAIDKTLVVPPGHELPLIPNLGFHAVPAAMLTLGLMLLSPPWTIKAYHAMALASVLAALYWGWVEYCFSINGWYPYPLLGKISMLQKMVLCVTIAALMTGSTVLLKWVYGRINGVEELRRDAFNPTKID